MTRSRSRNSLLLSAVASISWLLLSGCSGEPNAPAATLAPASAAPTTAPPPTPAPAAATVPDPDAAGDPAEAPAPATRPPIEIAPDDIVIPLELDEYGIMFSGRKSGLGLDPEPHGGGWNRIKGRVVLDATGSEVKDIQVTFDMKSLWTDHDRLTDTLKNNGWFEVEKYPTATFALATIDESDASGATHQISGDLTLHGVTRLVSFPVAVELSEGELHLTGKFEIMRSEFGVDGKDSTGLAVAVGKLVWEVHEEVGVEMDFTLPLPKPEKAPAAPK